MVWEQAALEHEEDRTRERAAELDAGVKTFQAALDEHGERAERERMIASARLEGHVAALRALALEAWGALASVATRAGLPDDILLGQQG